MKLNLKKPLIVFDLETTGLDLVKDRIIQISFIKIYPDGKEERKNYLVNPEMTISSEISELTGITNKQLKNAPVFKKLAADLINQFKGCDFAGFNSNRFDIPMLAEEFLRAEFAFDFSKSLLIDAQTIFHKMEKRNLAAAFKFYCGKNMDEEFEAHRADQDAEATYQVLIGELEKYNPQTSEDKDKVLPNDMSVLAEFSKNNDNVDFAGRIIWKIKTDKNGIPLKDSQGKEIKEEIFNFGKYKGKSVREVLKLDPGYYNWILDSEFTYNTKQVLTKIKLEEIYSKK